MAWEATAEDLIESAWGVIANVGGRDGTGWEGQHETWLIAAEAWRDRYLEWIKLNKKDKYESDVREED